MVTLRANHGQILWGEIDQRLSFLILHWCVTIDMVTLWADHGPTLWSDLMKQLLVDFGMGMWP
jgi:hypothetical protein